MSEAHAAENVRKDLAAGYDQVVCLTDEAVNLAGLKSKLDPLPPGALLGDLQGFETVLEPLLSAHSSLRGPNQNEEPRRRRRVTGRPAASLPTPTAASQLAALAGDPRALSTPLDAEYLGLSPATLETLRCRGGGPPFVKLGRRVVYRREDFEAWVTRSRRLSTSDTGEPRSGRF